MKKTKKVRRTSLHKFDERVDAAMKEALQDVKDHRPTSAEKEWSKTESAANRNLVREKKRVDALLNSGRAFAIGRLDPGARRKRAPIIGGLDVDLPVERLARDEGTKRVVRELVSANVDWPFPTRGAGGRPRPVVVEVEVRIMSYVTEAVPERLRTKKFKVRSVGEVLVRAAEMYDRIYREDERLGGEDTTKRDARLKRQKKPPDPLSNRGEGPYIWGHDIGDLVFEELCLRWTSDRSCVAYPGIGS